MKLTERVIRFILEVGKENSRERLITTSQVAKKTKITKAWSGQIVKRLEDNNFIYRAGEGRNKYVYLTTDGWKAFHSLRILRELDLQ